MKRINEVESIDRCVPVRSWSLAPHSVRDLRGNSFNPQLEVPGEETEGELLDLVVELSELVQRCKGGDQAAMTELVDRYKHRVFALCYRMLGHREDAEDVTQQTFLRMLNHLDRWDVQRPFEPWLLTIAGNRCRTALAARAKRGAMQPMTEPVPDPAPDPWAVRHLSEEVDLALQTLRCDHREAFVLFHLHEMSYDQIAEHLSRPVGTVKTWIHRARMALIQQLQRREALENCPYAVR
ncbi:MAG: RNA polymerase sigma factor [Pirellulaceae bacterium]